MTALLNKIACRNLMNTVMFMRGLMCRSMYLAVPKMKYCRQPI